MLFQIKCNESDHMTICASNNFASKATKSPTNGFIKQHTNVDLLLQRFASVATEILPKTLLFCTFMPFVLKSIAKDVEKAQCKQHLQRK